ncbi:unnamed protein product [Rotaria sp. Silwood2]|nr:unnamed protein product [Rotaria sp. Silwood2]CAF2611944.1 unnamed protein product [Rotaria sp. Silwood2]CAF2873160.1 unnamed protein product [Rotaria sp. Silwood2]CAF3025400.1 unnamed protein product [Rotaria sp. Silwood2]CAF3880133.1 unnamed protein product [Rotaria sp. Silwood2]
MNVLLIIICIVLFINGLLIAICLVRYSSIFRKSSLNLIDSNLVKSQVKPSSMISHSNPIINNFQSDNQIIREEKKPSISISRTSSLLVPSKVLWKNENFISDEFLQDTKHHHDYSECLRLGSVLIDRPLGIAMQPLDAMGPVLMKFSMCEQHWIRPDDH